MKFWVDVFGLNALINTVPNITHNALQWPADTDDSGITTTMIHLVPDLLYLKSDAAAI